MIRSRMCADCCCVGTCSQWYQNVVFTSAEMASASLRCINAPSTTWALLRDAMHVVDTKLHHERRHAMYVPTNYPKIEKGMLGVCYKGFLLLLVMQFSYPIFTRVYRTRSSYLYMRALHTFNDAKAATQNRPYKKATELSGRLPTIILVEPFLGIIHYLSLFRLP